MSAFVDAGLFQVDVNYEHVRPQVDFDMLDEYDSMFGTLLSQLPPVFDVHVYHVYLTTRPGHSPQYVMRLPSCFKSLDLPNLLVTMQWLTFSNMSVLVARLETSALDGEVKACMCDLAQWLHRVASYSRLLQMAEAEPNVATVLCCKDTPLLQAPLFMDGAGMPNWRVPLAAFPDDETCVFYADVDAVTTAVNLPVPPDVQRVLANLPAHSLHGLFPGVDRDRVHLEKRPPTPSRAVVLEAGDVIVYLSADEASLVFAQVLYTNTQQPYWLELHNAQQPLCFAKYNTANQVLESPLQCLDAFLPA